MPIVKSVHLAQLCVVCAILWHSLRFVSLQPADCDQAMLIDNPFNIALSVDQWLVMLNERPALTTDNAVRTVQRL